MEEERQSELAAVWGTEAVNGHRVPRRRGRKEHATVNEDDLYGSADDVSVAGDVGEGDCATPHVASAAAAKKAKKATVNAAVKRKKKESPEYRLHCIVVSGTTRNDVREVFEQYEPKVELCIGQKGNLLNKTHYCILTFPNKAMAMHAVLKLDGTNQRNTIGVHCMKLALMLTRKQGKKVRAARNRKAGASSVFGDATLSAGRSEDPSCSSAAVSDADE